MLRGFKRKTNIEERVTRKKKKSLGHLLEQQFGTEWKSDQELKWYKQLFEKDACDEVEVVAHCDCLEEEHAVHI